ncbi:hypothetical protein NQ117_04415 [Paenibacillus sp. SC116]|uniref:hypothetical protein n=1 Tax=Paenibacillus sp. SC116 TaxID=2968986 RepID=UPI00215A72D1|nr:hypothetical protein [Paenibacillus sp. SC116]MCR8842914.1 hypothetical protein [Paenibacillus sp. SC116]
MSQDVVSLQIYAQISSPEEKKLLDDLHQHLIRHVVGLNLSGFASVTLQNVADQKDANLSPNKTNK